MNSLSLIMDPPTERLNSLNPSSSGEHTAARIKIIKNNENKGFAGGNNQGMAAASGDYILLLNNDVVVTPGWLERMISCAEKRS